MKFHTLMPSVLAAFALFVLSARGDGTSLTWNGANGAVWDATEANWLDADNNAVAWSDGATAVFPGAGLVEVRGTVQPSAISFEGNGTTLVGPGCVFLGGDLTGAAGTTNSVVVRLVGNASFAKRGAGAVAIAYAKGDAAVEEGTLLFAGSRCASLRVTTAEGAAVEALEVSSETNLLENGSFEDTTVSSSYVYMNGSDAGTGLVDKEGTAVAPWKVSEQVVLANSAGVKTWCATVSGTGIPDGSQLCILQRFGTIVQDVTVSEDGWYDLSFTYYKRGNNYQDHHFSVMVDDVIVVSILANMIQQSQQDFTSGLVWLTAGTHSLRLAGEGWWRDVSTFVDDIRLAPPVAGTMPSGDSAKAANAVSGNWSDAALWADGTAPSAGGSATDSLYFPALDGLSWQNDLTGTYFFNSIRFGGLASGASATLAGNAISSKADTSTHGYISLDTPGDLTVSNDFAVGSGTIFMDVEGSLTMTGTVSGSDSTWIDKTGAGTLTLAGTISTLQRANVIDGTLVFTDATAASTENWLRTSTNGTATLRYDITEDLAVKRPITALGSGVSCVSLRTGRGLSLSVENSLNCYGPLVQLDVGEGDRLSFNKIQQCTQKLPYGCTRIVKTGAGTLSVKSAVWAPASYTSNIDGNIGSPYGGFTVREGFVAIGADDFGYQSGLTNIYTGTVFPNSAIGALGQTADVPLTLGDEQTPAGATVGVNGYGGWTCSARPYIATPYPAKVVVGAVTNGMYQMDTVVLRRGDLTLGGPTGDVEKVDVMLTDVTFDGVSSATITREGNVNAILNASSYPSGLKFVADTSFEVGFRRALSVDIGELDLSGSWKVSFSGAGNDSVTADTLVLGDTTVSLWDDANEQVFVQVGTYTLLNYTTLNGNVSSLSLDAASQVEGYTYAFADTGSSITLTITAAADNPVYTWTSAASGAWSEGGNWDHGQAPNGDTHQAVMGIVPQSATTVTLSDAATLNGLTFYNDNGYTLTGGTLSFGGTAPFILASAGDNTISNAVTASGGSPITVRGMGDGTVRFGGTVTGDLSLESGQTVLKDGMDLNGNVTVTGATLTVESGADISGTTTLGKNARLVAESDSSIGALAGVDSTAEIVMDGTLELGASDSSYAGAISGSGTLVKSGSATLTLNGTSIAHTGGTMVNAGTLSLGGTMLQGITYLASGAALKASGANPGVTGDYHGYFNADTIGNYWERVYSLSDYQDMLGSLSALGEYATSLSSSFSVGDLQENVFPASFGSKDYWAVAYKANLIVPETGFYSFYSVSDDQLIFLIDDVKVLSSISCMQSYGGCHLEKGIHTMYVGLVEQTGNAYVSLYVKQPSETSYKALPASWVIPDAGADELAGAGALAPDAGTVVSVRQATGFNVGFVGSLSGEAGGMVQKTGAGVLAARYDSGDVAVTGGELALSGGDSFGTVRTSESGTVHIANGTIRNLFGDGKAVFGSHVYVIPYIQGDADSGFSTNKTYTHLVNFPVGGGNTASINGVSVNNTGSWTGSSMPTSAWGQDSGTAETGFGRLVYRFIYGTMDFNVTLSGLTANKLYDLRLYFRNFSTSSRDVTFVFSRNGVEIGRQDWNPDRDENSKGRPYTAVGCRYVAGTDGTVNVRVISHDAKNKCHFYGFSNELVGDASGTEAISLVPAAGEIARQTGGISGTATLSLDGAGTQILGGTNSLPAPLAVNSGRLVLEAGSVMTAGVAVASGASLEMQGAAHVNGLSGAGTLSLSLGDNNPWGELQSDGTFAAPDWPRRVDFAGDADCGIAPFKSYTHFVNTGYGSNTVLQVNGVPITCVLDQSGTGTVHHDLHRGTSYTGLPQSKLVNNGEKNIVMDSSNAVWSFFNKFQYDGDVYLKLNGLTTGRKYEMRVYVRKWANQNRSIKLSYYDGTADKTYTFNEDTSPEGYVALQYTATNTSFTLTGEKQAQDGFHVYAFSNEEVADHASTIAINADSTFSGPITGNGELCKTGAGTWTLSGAGTASGAWTISEGAVVLDGATATTGAVAVASGASFGGWGVAGGAIGFASGSTLTLGANGTAGTLSVGGDVVVASGAAVSATYATGRCSSLAASGTVTLPSALTITALPATEGAQFTCNGPFITAGTALSGPSDFSGWSVVDSDGKGISGIKLSYGADGKSVYLTRSMGTLLMIR